MCFMQSNSLTTTRSSSHTAFPFIHQIPLLLIGLFYYYYLPPHFRFGLKVAPSFSFWAESCPRTFVLTCFSSSCKSVEKIFSRVYAYPPRPPNFCGFVVPVMKQAVKMYCLTCEFFFFVSNIN